MFDSLLKLKIKSFLAKILVLYGTVRFSLLLDNSSGALEKTANPHLELSCKFVFFQAVSLAG